MARQQVEVPMELCHCLSGSEQRRIQALPCRTGGRARSEEWSPEALKMRFPARTSEKTGSDIRPQSLHRGRWLTSRVGPLPDPDRCSGAKHRNRSDWLGRVQDSAAGPQRSQLRSCRMAPASQVRGDSGFDGARTRVRYSMRGGSSGLSATKFRPTATTHRPEAKYRRP